MKNKKRKLTAAGASEAAKPLERHFHYKNWFNVLMCYFLQFEDLEMLKFED